MIKYTPEYDKLAHFFWGAVLWSPIGSSISLIFDLTAFMPLILCLLVSLAKEIKDEKDYGGFDWKDLLFTVLPSVFHVIFLILYR